jgi:hypothetical protein
MAYLFTVKSKVILKFYPSSRREICGGVSAGKTLESFVLLLLNFDMNPCQPLAAPSYDLTCCGGYSPKSGSTYLRSFSLIFGISAWGDCPGSVAVYG